MDALINTALDAVWNEMCAPNRDYRTPDNQVGAEFSVAESDANSVLIQTGGGNPLTIRKQAFFAALKYLNEHKHGPNNRCKIDSATNPEVAGPLCLTTRRANTVDGNDGPRVITYIAPMLAGSGLVELDGNRPNQVWLA